MDPICLACFEYGGMTYAFREPVPVDVEYRDGMWVYHNEALNLWGYGKSQEDALRDLHQNFAYNIWRAFAEERDDVLDDKARAIKRRLTTLASEPHSDAAS